MNRIYSKDTDTLMFVFSDERIADVVDLDYQTLLELDCDGNPVALTIEHARERNVWLQPALSAQTHSENPGLTETNLDQSRKIRTNPDKSGQT